MKIEQTDMDECLRIMKDCARLEWTVDQVRRKMCVGFQTAWDLVHNMEACGMLEKTDKAWRWRVKAVAGPDGCKDSEVRSC